MLVSLATTITLTGWSERTIWRRLADGSIKHRKKSNGRAMIPFEFIEGHLCIPLEPEDLPVLERADAGDAESQNELGLVFLSNGKPKGAAYWLELAAKLDHPDAMNLLGLCYIEGHGTPKDQDLGMMWLSKAAALGHAISQLQMQALRSRLSSRPSSTWTRTRTRSNS